MRWTVFYKNYNLINKGSQQGYQKIENEVFDNICSVTENMKLYSYSKWKEEHSTE